MVASLFLQSTGVTTLRFQITEIVGSTQESKITPSSFSLQPHFSTRGSPIALDARELRHFVVGWRLIEQKAKPRRTHRSPQLLKNCCLQSLPPTQSLLISRFVPSLTASTSVDVFPQSIAPNPHCCTGLILHTLSIICSL